jgi:hypothetical protein
MSMSTLIFFSLFIGETTSASAIVQPRTRAKLKKTEAFEDEDAGHALTLSREDGPFSN